MHLEMMMNLELLDNPFEEEEIEWRAARCGKSNNGNYWVMVLAYVTNRAIMNRLDNVCGKGGWRNEYRDIPGGGVECGLSIKIDGEWITKWDAADQTQVEATKGGRSGAMKRAAAQWGIGRYLYNLTEGFGAVSANGKHNAKTKQGERFKWDPPPLPEWALPKSETNEITDHQSAWVISKLQSGATHDQIIEALSKKSILSEKAVKQIKSIQVGA